MNRGPLELLRCLWGHLGTRRRRQLCLLMVLMLVSALAEVVSLGAVLPFLTVLISPQQALNYPIISYFASMWGVSRADQLILSLAIAFAVIAFLAGVVRILLLWVSTKIAFAIGTDLSCEVYRRALCQPYEVHVAKNSSEVISDITNKVGAAVSALYQLLSLLSSTVLLVFIACALIAIDWRVAAITVVSFGTAYALITRASRQRLQQNSRRIVYEQTQVVKALQEGLGGIRDVLLDCTQNMYCDIYSRADKPLRRAQGGNIFIGQSPRYVIEMLGMILICSLAYALSLQVGGISTALPILGALALGAQRLLPALQQIYSAWASILGSYASLADIVEIIDLPLLEGKIQLAPIPLPFQSAIIFNNVSFNYAKDSPRILDSLNLIIPKGSRVGIVGATGSGKSTMLDLLMGFLAPTSGEVLVDGHPISGIYLKAWQRNIAHVPQSIYLADTTIAENIAFGVPAHLIDLKMVKGVAQRAQIADFIESGPNGYKAYVGERGIRLSGGQRQRIGIARALYKQASVLIFDEATSALDNRTERLLMESINDFDRTLTIISIAHRLTTVRHCDIIIEMENGRIISNGTYEQLLLCSPSFRSMAVQG